MEHSNQRIVIVGAGQAGVEAAAALRMHGHRGPLTIIGEEAHRPYSRPPLSKAFLTGTLTHGDIELRADEFYARGDITVHTGEPVIELDLQNRLLRTKGGNVMPYDSLILATGSEARKLPNPELASASNVLSLRSISDAGNLRDRLVQGARAVIIGGGYIGLEIASAAHRAGVHVTVLEASDRVLQRVSSAPISEFLQRVHREEGVEIITRARISGFELHRSGDVSGVKLEEGRVIDTDFVLVGIGVTPRTELAAQAGITVDNGIVVDEYFRTSAPGVYAIGDVARHPCPQNGGLRRLESAPNASEHARSLAATIMGTPQPYDALPWFWSDQFDLKLQSVGLAATADSLVVREAANNDRMLSVFYLEGGRLVAADVIGSSGEFAAAKKLVKTRHLVDPAILSDAAVPLKSLLQLQASPVAQPH